MHLSSVKVVGHIVESWYLSPQWMQLSNISRGLLRCGPGIGLPQPSDIDPVTWEAIHEYTGSLETDEIIWISIRKKEIQTKIHQFLFKMMHRTQKIGKFWTTITTLTHQEQCRPCRTTETMMLIASFLTSRSSRSSPPSMIGFLRVSLPILGKESSS
jgi:hypothetical protein